jgi:biopolymer transport protein ExbD
MAYHAPSKSRSINRGKSQGPNLVPIMNLFLVIIPMLITMIASTQMQLLAINLPTSGGPDSKTTESKVAEEKQIAEITIGILSDKFQIIVDEKLNSEIPLVEGRFAFDQLNNALITLKSENKEQNQIGIYPSGDVEFENFIRTMDICKLDGKFTDIKYITSSKKILVSK